MYIDLLCFGLSPYVVVVVARARERMGGGGKVSTGHGFSQMHWMRLCSSAAAEAAKRRNDDDTNDMMEEEKSVHADFPLNGLAASVDPLTNVVTMPQLRKHRGGSSSGEESDVWMAVRGKVYNVSPYMKYHPGGVDQLMRGAGMDATKLFEKYHRWVNIDFMLEKCLVRCIFHSFCCRKRERIGVTHITRVTH